MPVQDFVSYIKKNFRSLLLLLILGIVGFSVWALDYQSDYEDRRAISLCEEQNIGDVDKTVDCWYEMLRDRVETEGVRQTYALFDMMYDTSPIFAEMSCHEHAHVIGDVVYYQQYLPIQDLDKIEFPEETKACGYGFWHGFIEHFVQDRPSPALVDETCAYLTDRLEGALTDIRTTCYHAAGHGFMLAPIDTTDTSKWGKFVEMVSGPVSRCESLDVIHREVQECKIGVFNVIGRWMFEGEYGFSYNWDDPFESCRELLPAHQEPCYNEIAQKLDSLSDWDLREAALFVSDIEDDNIASRAIGVAAAGMMLREINKDTEYKYVQQCREINERLQDRCFKGILSGLFEYGPPGEEWEKPTALCESPDITTKEQSLCNEILFTKYQRYYSTDAVSALCKRNQGIEAYCTAKGIL